MVPWRCSCVQKQSNLVSSALSAEGVHIRQWLPAHRRQEGVQSGQPSQTAGNLTEGVHCRSALQRGRVVSHGEFLPMHCALQSARRLTVQ